MTFFREVENENDLFFLGCFKPTWLDLKSITLNILDPPPNLAKVRETVFGPGQVRHQRYTKAVEIMAPRRWNPPVGWPKIGICFGKHGEARGF